MENLVTINSFLKSSASTLSIESPIGNAIVFFFFFSPNKSSLVIIRSNHLPVDLLMFWLSSQMKVDEDLIFSGLIFDVILST